MSPKIFRPIAYQICVKILKAKHLPQNANPMVVVKVGNRRRKTAVRDRTDSPIYNEYFVFDLFCNEEELLSTKIMIAVYLKSYLRFKFHGSTSFEVALVWDQPDRQYYHKWAMLMNHKDLAAGPKGYVKCNIAINVKGEKLKVHPETEGEDDIEGNLLLPVGEFLPFRQRACYIFSIYRADGLPDMSSLCMKNDFENINPFIQISFAGMKKTTSQAWQTYGPRFNERITFREMFPSLCQRARIAIKHRIDSCRTCVVASYVLNLGKISHSGESGFLPTFGPSFIHFYGYGYTEKNSCFGKCTAALPLYRGRVLLSLKTEMDDSETAVGTSAEVDAIAPIIERSLWRTEEYYLVGVLYDISMIDRKRFWTKSVCFEISLGNAGNRQYARSQVYEDGNQMPDRRPEFESQTVPRLTGTLDGKYNYVPLGSRKPCLYVRSWWPNLEWRIHNTNSLSYIANFLEEKLDKLEGMIALEHPDAYKFYNETIRTTRSHCIRYLHILDTGRYDDEGGTTKLDRHRVNLCRKEIENILKRIKINGELPNNHYTRIAMVHAYQYLARVNKLREDPQHSLPHVFIWMIAGSKRVAYKRFPAEQIFYSEQLTERGTLCGKKMDVFLRNVRDDEDAGYVACKLEMFLWLGNAEYVNACWSSIPPGYNVDQHESADSFPKYLEYTRSAPFQLRAHIFQGRFDPGMDASGLLDPFVRVAFHGYTASTRVIKQTLDPFWDQTLLLSPRTLHGTKEYIKSNPPNVVLEIFDLDMCGAKELCGRCTALPLVKLAEETYSPPDFPPKLEWYKFKSQRESSLGSVLAAFELIETKPDKSVDRPTVYATTEDIIYNIPEDIRPRMTSYRLEVIFWGVRDMKKIYYMPVLNPRIVIECAGVHVKSEVMENSKKFSNYRKPHVIVDLDMPELEIYYPPVIITVHDSRGFGCFKYAGVYIIPSVNLFLEHLITEEDYNAQMYESKLSIKLPWDKKQPIDILPLPIDYDPSKEEENKELIPYKKMDGKSSWMKKIFGSLKKCLSRLFSGERKRKRMIERTDHGDESLDWWTKYFASLEEERSRELGSFSPGDQKLVATFQVYNGELEVQPQFAGFHDRLRTFELWRGQRSKDTDYDSDHYVGKFKGRICVYRWPHPSKQPCKTRSGRNAANGLCDDYPSTEPVKLLVRLYVVKGINLQPSDPLSGKSDPYLCVRIGRTYINDKKNYIPNQLNPTFGRLFEIDATFPQDYMIVVQVWDYDATSSDDLIGETKIDLENRFYSKHRATCGISREYQTHGYNSWRDRETPKLILEQICKKNNLPQPDYGKEYVKIGKKKFMLDNELADTTDREERMALCVLHQWQDFPICGCALVPEHIERRPLFNVERPGLEQGQLELWVDMFQVCELPPTPAVDITSPVPEEYEIRVIVWNTEAVPLVDSQFLTGEKCSDIYVKGWILYEDYQKTDIHYNSLTGEGNFNWRFVFRVMYLKGERVMIVRKKLSVFAVSETEEKFPCRLHLQVWDSDHFSPDDYLGSLTLDLSKMPRGSANSKTCTLRLLDPSLPTIDLFKVTRVRGWWPFEQSQNGGQYTQAGKVELEMSILRAEEADEQPAGKGRNPPQNLPPPNRPDTSFSWFRNPWKAFRFVVCRYYKWRIIFCFVCILVVLLACCAIYAFPGYMVKRLIGA